MGRSIIPQRFEFKCDACGLAEQTDVDRLPNDWVSINVHLQARDYHDPSFAMTLCITCGRQAVDKLDSLKQSGLA